MDEYTARRQADADFVHEELQREAAFQAGVAAERERCAKLCETWMVAAERDSGPEAAGWLHQMAQHMRGRGPSA